MTPIEHSIIIKRPKAEVFAFVTDFRNDKHWWKPVISGEKITPGETGVGTEFKQVSKVLFVTVHNKLCVTEWNPPHHVRLVNESPQLGYLLLYKFEEAEGGTRFTLEAQLEMKGMLKFIQPITMMTLHSQLETYFGVLKDYLESRSH